MGKSQNSHEASSMKGGHRVFAALYEPLGVPMERGWMGGRRARLLSEARGRVLEIGGGTGANLSYYGDVDRVTVVEADPFMRKRLGPKSLASGRPRSRRGFGGRGRGFAFCRRQFRYRCLDARVVYGPGSGVGAAGDPARLATGRAAAVHRARPRLGVHGPLAGSHRSPLGKAPRRLPSQQGHRHRHGGGRVRDGDVRELLPAGAPLGPHAARPGFGYSPACRLTIGRGPYARITAPMSYSETHPFSP